MKQFYGLFFTAILISLTAGAQQAGDTIGKIPRNPTLKKDTVVIQPESLKSKIDSVNTVKTDAVSRRPGTDTVPIVFNQGAFWSQFRKYVYEKNKLIGFAAGSEARDTERKIFHGKERLFYYIIFLLILFGLLRVSFAKYFYDLFRVFFRTTLKQKQVREQLLQSALPSIILNGYYVLTAGLYVNFLLEHFHWSITDNFWLQYLYCMIALFSIYLLKFIGLKLSGWLFNVQEATDSYIFIVFIINKMIGIYLLPVLVLIAFTTDPIYPVAVTLSWIGLGLLFGYRFILSYGMIRNEIKLNPFHFVLYLLTFEIIPLLLIYKLLIVVF